MPETFYNEWDAYALGWLGNLSAAGHIAEGVIDGRSIRNIRTADIARFRRCHFFAGIGIWDYALRAAGWPESREVWTGSCPCQPFSGAGRRAGFDDERHLWPVWFQLIRKRRPATILGEQVSSPDGRAWLDLVFDDLESIGYACGAVFAPACGVGAPHRRERIYWMAHASDAGRRAGSGPLANGPDRGNAGRAVDASGDPRRLGNAQSEPRGLSDGPGRLENSQSVRTSEACGPGPVNGFWADADWLGCTDGNWRPVEPATFPLAARYPARVGRLRAYGNALCAPQAVAFTKAAMQAIGVESAVE